MRGLCGRTDHAAHDERRAKAKALNIAQHANTHDAKEWLKAKVAGVTSWAAKPGIEQAKDVAEQAGDVMVPHPASLAVSIVTGGLGRGALRLADEAADVGKLSKTARSAAKVRESLAEHLSPAVRPKAGSTARIPGRHGAFRQAKRDAGIPSLKFEPAKSLGQKNTIHLIEAPDVG